MKDIADMTADELDALPVFEEFESVRYEVGRDGTVTLPNGHVLRGLVGRFVNVPCRSLGRGCFMIGPTTPLCWCDRNGQYWRPVRLVTGEWMKEPA